ncbi:MAG: hypothetical protein KDE27_29600 [Planctomycetes bacterium]|nr:hypothetical protein [Planctomycetota bacterium]
MRAVLITLVTAIVVTPLSGQTDSGIDSPSGTGRRITRAQCAAHLEAMQSRIPTGFDTVLEPPFVVLGDGGRDAVARSAERTVRWAVELLRRDFFRDDPREVLEVWLFDGKTSYQKHCRELFGEPPTTPFGFYSPRHGALIMNIATGGGTLVHEIVHPFVAANVEDCPAWLNEGLGSLFEQCRERDGRITGLLNWRLDGLQQAIRAERTVPLGKLLATSSAEFYGERSGLHYAEARYLLYWLQENGKLQAFWRDWLATRERDPTAAAAMRRALAIDGDGLAAFQREWEGWLLRQQR